MLYQVITVLWFCYNSLKDVSSAQFLIIYLIRQCLILVWSVMHKKRCLINNYHCASWVSNFSSYLQLCVAKVKADLNSDALGVSHQKAKHFNIKSFSKAKKIWDGREKETLVFIITGRTSRAVKKALWSFFKNWQH